MAHTIIMKKEGGRLTFDKEPSYIFSLLQNGTYSIEVKKVTEKRTVSQNALMWMWFSCIERETGTPMQDVHDYYCKKFLCRVVHIGERMEKVVGETKRMNTQQMTEFLNKVQADAATELGITLPRPEDRFFSEFYSQFNY